MIYTVIEWKDGERFTRTFPSLGHYMDYVAKYWDEIKRIELRKGMGA